MRGRNASVAAPEPPTFGDLPSNQEGFKIRVARLPSRRHEAGQLVEKRYDGRGYRIPSTLASVEDAHLSTFLAYDKGRIVGTVSLRLDSPLGLAADQLYPEETGRLRQVGHRLCEFTRLAVDSEAASKPVLALLFHTAFLYASRLHQFTHAVIEVNPRHVPFYQRSLGFEIVGDERLSPRVNAPAMLLEVPFSRIDAGLRRAGQAQRSGRASPFMLHGFSPDDEPGVLQCLRDKVRVA